LILRPARLSPGHRAGGRAKAADLSCPYYLVRIWTTLASNG